MIKAYVDTKMLSEDQRDHAITRGNDRGDAQDDRPFQFTLEHQNFGEDDSGEQHDAIAAAAEYHQGEYDTQPGIPGRNRQAFIFVNEADPLEDYVSSEKNRRPDAVAQVDANRGRQHADCLSNFPYPALGVAVLIHKLAAPGTWP